MMKKKYYRLISILFVMSVILTGVSPVIAAEKTEFQCAETVVAVLNPGTWSFPNSNVHIRGMVQLLDTQASDPRLIGTNTVVINANWQADWTGPVWGTFRLVTAYGGWEGTWAGQMTEQGSWYNAVGEGFGDYAGMKLWWDMDYGICRGEILE